MEIDILKNFPLEDQGYILQSAKEIAGFMSIYDNVRGMFSHYKIAPDPVLGLQIENNMKIMQAAIDSLKATLKITLSVKYSIFTNTILSSEAIEQAAERLIAEVKRNVPPAWRRKKQLSIK